MGTLPLCARSLPARIAGGLFRHTLFQEVAMVRLFLIDAALTVGWLGAAAVLAAASPSAEMPPVPRSTSAETGTPAPEKPGSKDAPISIMTSGNRLMIVSDDPEALKLAQELVRLLTRATKTEGDFDIIKLKNANAVEAARLL